MEAKFKIDDAIKFTATVENKYTLGDEGRIDEDGVFERNGKYFYNVKSAGKIVTDVVEDDLTFVYSSVERNVDEILRKKDEKKSFKDSDVRVSGTKKEKMAYKGMVNAKDLEDMEKKGGIAKSLVKKDKVYPEINTTEQIDKGVSGGCLFLKMKARDFVHQMPPDTLEFRSLYLGLCQWVYELFDDAMSLDDFEFRRKFFINGIIRKAILIANPEMEDELILQNNEYEQEVLKLTEYKDNYNRVHEHLYESARKADLPTWDYSKMEEAFPDIHKELQYWNKLKNISQQFENNKILPLEYRFLHNLALVDKEGDKTSILTGRDLPQGNIGESKNIDTEYILNFSGVVRGELIKNVFGEKFYMFIKKQTRSGSKEQPYTYTVYEDAKKYEPFTEEDYTKVYESQIKPIEESIEKHYAHIKYLSDPEKSYKDKFDYALKEANMGSWSWGNKNTFAKMVSSRDYNEAERLMNNIVNSPNSGFQMVIKGMIEGKKDKYGRITVGLNELKKKYFVRENNYSFLEKADKKERKKSGELKINSGIPLSHIIRNGSIEVNDSEFSDNDKLLSYYKNILGITRITYGSTLEDDLRVTHAKRFAQSIIDISEALNWDIKYLTGLGNLGIMFAADGRGGAMAHFSSDKNAINLTRSKGDGSVAHELLHYLDYNIASKYPNDRKSEQKHAVYGSYIKGGAKNISNNNIQKAYDNLMEFIKYGVYITRDNKIDDTKINKENPVTQKMLPLLPEFLESVISSSVTIKVEKNNKTLNRNYKTIDEYIKHLRDYSPQYLNYNYYLDKKTRVLDTLGAILNDLKMDSYEFQLSNKPYSHNLMNRSSTVYFKNSSAIRSPYWIFDFELFARAGETYFVQKLISQGRSNNYLVNSTGFDRREGVYPVGLEKDLIYILFDNLFETIKTEMQIPDFSMTGDRVDEYVELPKDEEDENSLVVDEKTKEVIDGDEELMKQKELAISKMNKLKELLSKSGDKFQDGGEMKINGDKLVNNLFSFTKQ
jgi:hypothetical protein